jgi:hypothetical protein
VAQTAPDRGRGRGTQTAAGTLVFPSCAFVALVVNGFAN